MISREFALVGGVEKLAAMCDSCPANATPQRLAGCAGTIYRPPESQDTQSQLDGIVSRLELETAIAKVFPRVQPRWYSFWTSSPLSSRALELLRSIFEAMLAEDRLQLGATGQSAASARLNDLDTFVRALSTAQQQRLDLYVDMAPPGHTDFGYYTVFPHCPQCKAEACIERWQRRYPAQHVCHACGTQYSPAETASSKRDDYAAPDLRDVLGNTKFPSFAKAYLKEQGLDDIAAAKIVFATERQEAERRRSIAEAHRREQLRQSYAKKVLFAGLYSVSDEPDHENYCDTQLFSAEEFRLLLARCQANRVRIGTMRHVSQQVAGDRLVTQGVAYPSKTFEQWTSEGCNELFGASFIVPDKLLSSLGDVS
ncbi:MAG: hypothetical protein AB7U73_16085 [Pirellulales bacterium]